MHQYHFIREKPLLLFLCSSCFPFPETSAPKPEDKAGRPTHAIELDPYAITARDFIPSQGVQQKPIPVLPSFDPNGMMSLVAHNY